MILLIFIWNVNICVIDEFVKEKQSLLNDLFIIYVQYSSYIWVILTLDLYTNVHVFSIICNGCWYVWYFKSEKCRGFNNQWIFNIYLLTNILSPWGSKGIFMLKDTFLVWRMQKTACFYRQEESSSDAQI